MSMFVKKRQLLSATLIIALGAAVAVNWFYNSNYNQSGSDITTSLNEFVSGNLGDSILVAGTVEYNDNNEEAASSDSETAYFAQAKLKRSEANDGILDLIDDLTEKEALTSHDMSELNKKFDDYKNTVKWQTDAENLIFAKTGNECLVVINENSCQVIMKKNTLNDTVILQITEIIEKNTNISAENLSIIEVK